MQILLLLLPSTTGPKARPENAPSICTWAAAFFAASSACSWTKFWMRSSLVSDPISEMTIYSVQNSFVWRNCTTLDSTFFRLDTVFSLLQYLCNQKYQPQPWSLLHTAAVCSWKVEIPTLKFFYLEKNSKILRNKKVQKQKVIINLLMEKVLHHLGYTKPFKLRHKLPRNWCRISFINRITYWVTVLVPLQPRFANDRFTGDPGPRRGDRYGDRPGDLQKDQ